MSSLVGPDEDDPRGKPPVPEHVQDAIRTLIEWTGDDPEREGLLDTPKRVARAWKEYCIGYTEDPAVHLDRVLISPEGCASILWRTAEKAPDAAEAMKVTAQDLAELGVIDRIVPEPVGGAHRDPRAASASLGNAIFEELDQLAGYAPHELKRLREERFLALAG